VSKNLSAWIEENGTVRTVFRKLALWNYYSPESCRPQLVNAIEKKNLPPTPYLVQYATDLRKMEIRWISIYLPILGFMVPLSFFAYVAANTHNIQHLYLAVCSMVSLGFIYRVTWYSQYLEACRNIYIAGDYILQEVAEKKILKENELPIAIEATTSDNFVATPASSAASEAFPDKLKKETPIPGREIAEAAPFLPEIDLNAETLTQISLPENGLPRLEDPTGSPNKGTISTILLHELIKKEAGRPSIHKGDIHKNVQYYAYITGCKPKNILDKVKYYEKREGLNLVTSNSLTTHRKYLEQLLPYYEETGDLALYNQAEDLLSYVENISARKKL
jgi:hypothetical protein